MLFVVSSQLCAFPRDLFEDVADEGVHNAHRPLGNSGFRMDLLEHAVDVNGVVFSAFG